MKRIFKISCVLFIALSLKGNAQSINYNDPLPVDKSVKKGVLPNGMTYYIKSTKAVKGAASYYIIQNVGSILEEDNQQGLAHFLEHMAFNGTEHFPGKAMLNSLEKHGATFGKDINAYTSFDETVYNLNNIPTKDGLVDTCLTVLKDWSKYLLLTDKEIDAERGVIKEEWRTRQTGRMRLYNGSMPVIYNNSKYVNRMPIGLMSVVEGFQYKALRDFYHDWYRTDLQAIAIIGDVDVNEIEKKILKQFSTIPAVENPKKRFTVDIPDNTEMLYNLGKDPEVSASSISFEIRHKESLENETVKDLKRALLEGMVTQMLSIRIAEKAKEPSASFLGAGVGYSPLNRTSNSFSINVNPKSNKQAAAFEEVLTEVMRAVRFGFVQSEVDRTITQFKTYYENEIAQKNDWSHEKIEKTIQSNYLNNATISDIDQEYTLAKKIFESLTLDELHQTIQRLYAQKNRSLNITGVEGEDNLTENQAKLVITTVENDRLLQKYTETAAAKTLISDAEIKKGKITKTVLNKDINASTFTLSNGVVVHYKFTNKQKDNVELNAISKGGTSLLKDDELPSAEMVQNLVQMSGLGDFNATDLERVMAGKTANIRINLSEINEGVTGSSNTKDVETMLQMIHLSFVKPRFEKQAYEVMQNQISTWLLSRKNDVGEKMNDSLTITLYGKNNPKKRLFNEAFVKDLSFDKVKKIYQERFADVSDSEFFIIGDVSEEQLKPLLEKYIASIPSHNTKENFIDNGPDWISSQIKKDIYLEMKDPKATVNVTYKKEMPYSVANSIYANTLGDILQLRVLATVREAEGGAYSPRATGYFMREPKPQMIVAFNFDCNPDMADKLAVIVDQELQKIADGDISDEDLLKVRTSFVKEREQYQGKNAYDMSLITKYFRYGENMNDPENFEKIVNKMTKADIQNLVKRLLNDGKSFKIIFKPENYKKS
ncbi:M16 family metallopeptidase [Flavobacterium pectinovorum]|uniref:M16 family metallopeptidase n=1 Tax=Flavobacterium pectinovorum TaxID=29533 RepID=UPI001FAD3D39|nr:M16 family metallopeptidase [Flavobacterium pectinovorum]MCI9844596.1 insulinase family protein [Flavobacterium pectinovorum]